MYLPAWFYKKSGERTPGSFETGIFNNMIDDYEHFHSTVVLHPDNQVAK